MINDIVKFGDESLDVSDRSIDHGDPVARTFPLLRAFIEDTYERSSFHRDRMSRARVSPRDIAAPDDLCRIPILAPHDVSQAGETLLLPDSMRACLTTNQLGLPFEERLYRRFASTGTTGMPKISHYTYADWFAAVASSARSSAHLRDDAHAIRTFNCFYAGHIAGKLTEDSSVLAGIALMNRHFATPDDASLLTQLYTGFADVGGFNCLAISPMLPPELVAKGGTLDSLLRIDDENYIGRKIECVLTGGFPSDLPGFDVRERLWEANELAGRPHAAFLETYGASEALPIGVSCDAHDGIHLHFGPSFIEVVDETTGQHVAPGGRGFVVVTSIRHGSRFVRYALGDEATYDPSPCACGKTAPRLKQIRRVLDRERLRQGCAAGGLG